MERSSRWYRQAGIFVATCIAIAGFLGVATVGAQAGKVENLQFEAGTGAHPYILFTPDSYEGGGEAKPIPLVVAAHGCMTTADQFMNATQFNEVAEREGFAVAYVDVDPATAALPQPLKNCWRFYESATYKRDQGHAAAVAGMTRAVMDRLKIDPERVYMAGTSAGGFMTSAMSAAYPDLFAAVSIVAGGSYQDGGCLGPSPGLPVEMISESARNEMGSRARIVPRMVMGGDADQGISPSCADKALFQGLRTNNLVLGADQNGPISLTPASSRTELNPGGYDSTVDTYLDPAGCLIAERWMIHGMGHFWPGGPSDPAWKNWTDPKGPSGAEASWAFFKRYTKSDTAMPCAEAPVPVDSSDKTCVKRKVTVALPKRTRGVRATVNGKKVRSKIVKRRLRVWLPAGTRDRTVLRVEGRKKNGKKFSRRLAWRDCGPSPKASR